MIQTKTSSTSSWPVCKSWFWQKRQAPHPDHLENHENLDSDRNAKQLIPTIL